MTLIFSLLDNIIALMQGIVTWLFNLLKQHYNFILAHHLPIHIRQTQNKKHSKWH